MEIEKTPSSRKRKTTDSDGKRSTLKLLVSMATERAVVLKLPSWKFTSILKYRPLFGNVFLKLRYICEVISKLLSIAFALVFVYEKVDLLIGFVSFCNLNRECRVYLSLYYIWFPCMIDDNDHFLGLNSVLILYGINVMLPYYMVNIFYELHLGMVCWMFSLSGWFIRVGFYKLK